MCTAADTSDPINHVRRSQCVLTLAEEVLPNTTDLKYAKRSGTAIQDANAPMMRMLDSGKIRGLLGYLS